MMNADASDWLNFFMLAMRATRIRNSGCLVISGSYGIHVDQLFFGHAPGFAAPVNDNFSVRRA